MPKILHKDFYTKLLLLFIIFQPVLDILTFLSIRWTDSSLTIGIVVRVLFMALSLWFILFGNSSRYKKPIILYLAALAAAFGFGLVYNYFAKPIFDPFTELQFVAKTAYFSIMLGSYLLLFTTIEKVSTVRLRILQAISAAMLIVSISLLVAILTGTSTETYEWNKFGYKGWFFAGNELGSIVSISFPLVYLYALYKIESLKNSYLFIPVVLLAIVSILIGTKVPYFAVLMAAVIVFFSYLIYWLIQWKKKQKGSLLTLRLVLSFCFLLLFAAVSPFSPAFSNVAGDIGAIEEKTAEQEEKDKPSDTGDQDPGDKESEGSSDSDQAKQEEEQAKLMDSPILVILLSARNLYFAELYQDYTNADIVQKTFGMGYAGNYTDMEDRKLIEMDFFDLFFSYGILGFTLILLPFLFIIGLFVKLLFQVPGRLLHPENLLILLSIGFGTGIAFIAGHVLYAPAVSIYLAVAMSLLIINMLKMQNDHREAKQLASSSK
ncbi:hypothetical protein HBHAL_4470 [Halobacillus halophilus DSM 2266]|uniref:Uncharacterized protein n=1 Tax=Halobacillus halophilus (strain ATCC 35676 / DSM 2266 / JCM 20832 / KCTC 3685 / LMG 17431 / NBRC 102448 / NCIMB 2269) TaxID=866895 RepID=I0JRN9_HALH3|nr:O-antigen ligase family protein [Halobacillus halophilus]CCG46810.1 hypothetical protein HBHAL_4470 [Halobacillus halophilus DSM 2266]